MTMALNRNRVDQQRGAPKMLKAAWEMLLRTQAPASVLVVRLMVGGIFLSEGIQKFLFPDALGIGRFLKIGIPYPEILAPFVGFVEIFSGTLVLMGFMTRLAAFSLVIDMVVAIATTKVPILIHEGFFKMAHEARTDYAMLLGSFFLILVGAGPWSLDRWAQKTTAGKDL